MLHGMVMTGHAPPDFPWSTICFGCRVRGARKTTTSPGSTGQKRNRKTEGAWLHCTTVVQGVGKEGHYQAVNWLDAKNCSAQFCFASLFVQCMFSLTLKAKG